MVNNKEKVVIIGAGLSGLSAAYHGDDNVAVYEKESFAGGMCYSPHIDGYTFDYGIHVLHTKDEYVLNLLKGVFNLNIPCQTRSAWIYSHDTYTRYPMQANTYGLPIPIVKKCLIDFINIYGNKKDSFLNYEDWILNTFGAGFGKNFLIPYSEKFWTVAASDMTTDWIDVRIPKPDLDDVIEGALTDQKKGFGPNSIFMYPENNETLGIGALPALFEKFISRKNIPIIYNKELIKIDFKNKLLTFQDNTCQRYSQLISTIPLPELIRIITPNPPDEVRKAVSELKYNSILCVNLGINKLDINPNHWIYYPEKEVCFFRISFLKNFSKDLVPPSKSSVTAEISYSQRENLCKDEMLKRTIDDLKKCKIITSDDDIVSTDVRNLKYGYVIYDHMRKRNLDIIKNYLFSLDIITAGRYGSWEYQWMDHAILDGKRAIEEAANRL